MEKLSLDKEQRHKFNASKNYGSYIKSESGLKTQESVNPHRISLK